jgi:tetratricopeptide (TPR) repeat protein
MTVDTGQARLARARALLDVGRCEAARHEVMAVLAEEPQNAEALCLLAHSYQAEDDFTAMRDAARQAVEADPEHQNGHVLLAFALVGLNDWEPARASALEGIRLQPEDWRGHSALATAELGLGHPRLALQIAARAVDLAPLQPGPHFIRGLLYDAIGLRRKARRSYRQTLAVDPQHTAALTRLGRLAVGGARLSEAAGHLGTALSAAPTDHDARTQLDRLLLGGLAGWAIMAVWTAGLLGLFTMFLWAWVAVLLPLAAWYGWAARTWRSLSPGLRAYARHMLRNDPRARVRLVVLAVCTLTAAALTASGSVQDPHGQPPAWLLIPVGAHLLSLMTVGAAILSVDRRVAGPPQTGPRLAGAEPAPTDMLAEHRRSAPAGRLVLRTFRAGALFTLVPWVLSIDPPAPWLVRAPVALAALAALSGYGWWARRRLLRRPGSPNAALGVLLLPMTLAVMAELAVLGAAALLPSAALPLPDAVAVPGFLAIVVGIVAWVGGLGYAAVAGVGRLLGRRRTAATPTTRKP